MDIRERFDAKWAPEPNTGCWLWTAGCWGNGYARFSIGRRHKMASRISWELAHGKSLPDDRTMVIDHLCRNIKCVNPEHLELVTQGINMRRGKHAAVIRQRHASATHCKRGHGYAIVGKKPAIGCMECSRLKYQRYWWSRGNARRLLRRKEQDNG